MVDTSARASPFHADTHFQIAWDSVSLGTFKECPRRYYYEIILGWRPKGHNVHLKFGQLYHAALEAYDHWAAELGKLEGGLTDDEHDEGVRRALRRAIRESGHYVCADCNGTGNVAVDSVDICPSCGGTGRAVEGGNIASRGPWQPWPFTDPYKNMWTLARSIVWYLDHFRTSPLRTLTLSNGKPAVELSFYYAIGDTNGVEYGLCGHLDRLVTHPLEGNRPSIHDRKTTKSYLNSQYWAGFNPNNQFAGYVCASSVHYSQPTWGITVDAAQVLVNSTAFAQQFIPYPPATIEEWLGEAHTWIALAARYAAANTWPKNDRACNNYGGCPFRKVCSKSPAFRQGWLEADFVHSPWNPLAVRGDI